jgi:hypothetical protein
MTIKIPVELDRRGSESRYINTQKVEIPITHEGMITSVIAVLPDGTEFEVPLSYPISVLPKQTLTFDPERITVNGSFVDNMRAVEKRVLDAAVQRVEALVAEETVFGFDVLPKTAIIAAIRGE